MSLYDALLRVAGGTDQPVDGSKGVWLKSGTITISSAMKMVGAVVSTGQSQFVYSKGVAQSCTVNYNRPQYIYKGGIAKNTEAYGLQHVSSGGAAYDTVVYQRQYVSSGGMAYRTVLSSATGASYPAIDVNSAAVGVFGLTVLAGASAWLQGLAMDVVASSGGHVTIYPTGVVSGLTAACDVAIQRSGVVYNEVLSQYGTTTVNGSAYNVSVLQGGQINVFSAGYLSGGYASATATNGAQLYVRSGASADNVTVDHFGYVVPYGGTITDVVVSSRGLLYTVYSGCASSVHVLSGGKASAATSGSYLKDVVVESGGTLSLLSYASAYDVILSRGGAFPMQSAIYASGVSAAQGFTVTSLAVIENLYASVTAFQACTILPTALVSGAYVESGDFRFNVSGRLESVYTGSGAGQNRIFSGGVVEDLVNSGTPWSCTSGGSLGRATQLAGNIYIYSGAVTIPAAIVISGGALRPENGGVVSRPTVYNKGGAIPYNSGVVSEALIHSGGSITHRPGGSSVDCILSNGAAFYLSSGCSAINLVRRPWAGINLALPSPLQPFSVTYPNANQDVNAMPPVTNGLVCWFDAMNNTGSGFDSTTSVWVDRAGSGFDITFDSTKAMWKNGGFTNITGGYTPATPSNIFTEDGDFTVEVVGDTNVANTTRQSIMYFNDWQAMQFLYYLHSGYFYYNNSNTRRLTVDRRAGGIEDAVAAPCAAIVVSNFTASGYVEGALTTSASFTGNALRPVNQPLRLFGQTGTGIGNYIYSIRIYNRALTAEEIHQNWLFDRTRYFGARSLDTPVDGQYGVFIKSGTETVSSAMEMFDTQLTAPYTQQIYNGGLAADGVVSGATQTVLSGGTAKRCVVSSGGTLIVSSGGTALAVTSNTGATVTVLEGGYIEYVTP